MQGLINTPRQDIYVEYIDLSVAIENGLPSDPPFMIPEISYIDHREGAREMSGIFEGLEPLRDLPDGKGWAVEKVSLTTHTGTHMDAPYHYAPVMDRSTKERDAWTIDRIPLEWCVGHLVVLDLADMPDGYVVVPSDIDKALDRLDYQLRPGDIVCAHTAASIYWESSEYLSRGCGIGREATLHILRQGVRVVGTDAWSWDAPFTHTGRRWKESLAKGRPDPGIIWEGHFAGIEMSYCQMEKLTNLDKVPPLGATIYCFPVKIKDASAGWVRAVAAVRRD
ncbi:MAG: cyclase family protein [Deltaproteobacteria bacterium]|nr:cyclase family protein [Deltaproteobacteria bacterium]